MIKGEVDCVSRCREHVSQATVNSTDGCLVNREAIILFRYYTIYRQVLATHFAYLHERGEQMAKSLRQISRAAPKIFSPHIFITKQT